MTGIAPAAAIAPIEASHVAMNVAQQEKQLAAEDERTAKDDREQEPGDGGRRKARAPLAGHPSDDVSRPGREHHEGSQCGREHHDEADHDLDEAPSPHEAISPGSRHRGVPYVDRQTTPGGGGSSKSAKRAPAKCPRIIRASSRFGIFSQTGSGVHVPRYDWGPCAGTSPRDSC